MAHEETFKLAGADPAPVVVAALYQFTPFADCAALRGPLLRACRDHGIKGTLLLAHEGINGTIAGLAEGLDEPALGAAAWRDDDSKSAAASARLLLRTLVNNIEPLRA